jgi:hypothetical protein
MDNNEICGELLKFWLSFILFQCEPHWWFYTRWNDNQSNYNIFWFTTISNANSEFIILLPTRWSTAHFHRSVTQFPNKSLAGDGLAEADQQHGPLGPRIWLR